MAKMVNKQGSEKRRQKEHIPKGDKNKGSKFECDYKRFINRKISSAEGTAEEDGKTHYMGLRNSYCPLNITGGYAVVPSVVALRYNPEGHGFNSRWTH